MEIFKLFGSIFLKDEDVNKKLDGVDKKAAGVGKSIGTMGDMFTKTGKTISSMGKFLTTAITGPIVAAAAVGFSFNSAMEQAQVNFTTMLGSAEKAKSMIANLKTFAEETPFEMTGLAESAQMLLSFGMDAEQIMPSIKMLGDVAMGNKDKFKSLTLAFAQIQSTGRLMGQDLLQLVNAGFNPLQIISEKTGISMKDLKKKMEAGAISADMVTEAFRISTSEGGRFYKAMESGSKTFEGLMSTFGDTVKSTLGDLVKPLFDKFTQNVLPALIEKVKEVQAWFSSLSPEMKNQIANFALLAAVIGPLLFIFGKTVSGLGGIIKMFKNFKAATLIFNLQMVGIVIGVAALAAIAYLLIKNWDKVGPFFSSMWTVLKNAFVTGGASLMVSVRLIQLGLAKFLDFTAGNLLALYSGLFGFMAKIPGIGDVFKGVQGGIDGLRNSLKGFVKSSEEDLDTAKSNAKASSDETAKAWGNMTKAASELGKGMGNTIKDTVAGIKGIFKSVPQDAKEAGKDAGKDAGNAFDEGLKDGLEDAEKTAKEAYEKLKNEFDSFGSTIVKALRKRYDAQEKIETDAIDDSLDREKTAHSAKLKLYDEEYKAKLKALNAGEESAINGLQSQIDAINNLTDTEEKTLSEKEYQQKIADLRESILQAESNEDKIGLQEELDQAIAEHERNALLDSRQLQIKQLELQMDAIREKAQNDEDALSDEYDRKKEAADNEYDLLIEGLNNEKDALQTHYAALAEEEALQAEARKLVISKDQDAIIELLNTFAPGWQDAGQSFGESLINGLNSAKQSVAAAIAALLGNVPGGGGGGSGLSQEYVNSVGTNHDWYDPNSGVTRSQYESSLAMQANSAAWTGASAAERTRLANENLDLGQSMGWTRDTAGVWHTASGAKAYAEGTDNASPGWHMVGERGPELVEFHGGEKVTPNDKLGGTVINLNVKTDNPSDMRQAKKYGEAIVNFLHTKGVNPA